MLLTAGYMICRSKHIKAIFAFHRIRRLSVPNAIKEPGSPLHPCTVFLLY